MEIRNYGISGGVNFPGYIYLVIGVFLITFYWAIRTRKWYFGLMVLGGGLNLWQRLRWGYVVDYWKLPLVNLYNNFNDWLIFIGFIGFIWEQCHQKK